MASYFWLLDPQVCPHEQHFAPDSPGRSRRDSNLSTGVTAGRPAASSCAQLLALKLCSLGMARLALAGHRLQHRELLRACRAVQGSGLRAPVHEGLLAVRPRSPTHWVMP